MATIKVFATSGVKELKCFDRLWEVPFLDEEEEEPIVDDGELTVGTPISE